MQAFATTKELQPLFDLVSQGRSGENALVVSLPLLSRDSPRRMRGLVRSVFAGSLRGAALLDVLLVSSELLTNALLHGAPPAVLAVVQWPDRTALAVHDSSPTMPELHADSRSGLAIVENMTDGQWGHIADGAGKWVWACLAVPPLNNGAAG